MSIIAQGLMCPYQPGRTVYANLWYPDFSKIWNTSTPGWESYLVGHFANYQVSVTDPNGIGVYTAAFPSQISGVVPVELFYDIATPTNPIYSDRSQGANIGSVAGDQIAGSNLGASTGSIVQGAAVTGTLSVSQMTTNLTNAQVSAFIGRTIIWTSGLLKATPAGITAYLPTGGLLTFTSVPVAPSNGDTFVIV